MIKIVMRLAVLLTLCISSYKGFSQKEKPRVIVMTDGEVDDRCSMVRFLLHTNDVDLLGIIQTNSVYQRKGWVEERWLEKQVDAYAQIYPNLIIHDSNYPNPELVRSKIFVGDNDSTHITVDGNSPSRIPGQKPTIDPANWKDTEGSDKIVDILLDKDPRPVFIQAWGGGNTAAKAFYKLKAVHPKEYKRAISKVVMYNIWYQDGAGSYIEQNHPDVKMLLSHYFNATWAYGTQNYTRPFVSDHLRNHPLGKFYTQAYISEGDSPAFLYSLDNGLRGYENPAYGGWGGRFYKVRGFTNVYRDIDKASYSQWIEAANRDFEARLQWAITPRFADANHKPKIKLGARELTVRSGQLVKINAELTDDDPINFKALWDKYGVIYEQKGVNYEGFTKIIAQRPKCGAYWWQFKEAGTCSAEIDISNPQSNNIQFIAPTVRQKCTIHLILEATDNGSPALTSFERVIITIVP